MQLDSQAQAIMLLTVAFGKTASALAKPLSTREWGRFAAWLREHDLQPSFLLEGNLDDILAEWRGVDDAVPLTRLAELLERGGALGLALEKWQRAGLWVMTRSDADYPGALKQRLKEQSPPVLFGCGNRRLLGQGGVAVVGSRNATEADLDTTRKLGAEVADQGQSVVSGGARGVDQAAMLGALEREGTAVGVLADSLLRSATSAMYRNYLTTSNLVIVSPYNPEAGFNVGNAMARNRCVYCLADQAVVISSDLDKGGTWQGATEALLAQWIPLWTMTGGHGSGNAELIRRGARPWEAGDFGQLFADRTALAVLAGRTNDEKEQVSSASSAELSVFLRPLGIGSDFYDLFLSHLEALTSEEGFHVDDICTRLNLKKSQVSAWLEQGIRESKVRKLRKPVRYQFAANDVTQKQLNLLVDVTSG